MATAACVARIGCRKSRPNVLCAAAGAGCVGRRCLRHGGTPDVDASGAVNGARKAKADFELTNCGLDVQDLLLCDQRRVGLADRAAGAACRIAVEWRRNLGCSA